MNTDAPQPSEEIRDYTVAEQERPEKKLELIDILEGATA